MCCDWYNSLLVTGDRGGQIRFFDINSGTCIFSCNNHSGAVSKVFLQSDNGGCNVVGSAGL